MKLLLLLVVVVHVLLHRMAAPALAEGTCRGIQHLQARHVPQDCVGASHAQCMCRRASVCTHTCVFECVYEAFKGPNGEVMQRSNT